MPTSVIVTPIKALVTPTLVGADGKVADILTTRTGTVAVDADGDLRGATPLEALRARVERMITNPPNAYYHLKEWGMRAKKGSLARPTDLARLQLQAEKYLREDPDIVEARVTAYNKPKGISNAIMFEVQIRTKAGLTDNFLTTLGG